MARATVAKEGFDGSGRREAYTAGCAYLTLGRASCGWVLSLEVGGHRSPGHGALQSSAHLQARPSSVLSFCSTCPVNTRGLAPACTQLAASVLLRAAHLWQSGHRHVNNHLDRLRQASVAWAGMGGPFAPRRIRPCFVRFRTRAPCPLSRNLQPYCVERSHLINSRGKDDQSRILPLGL